MTFIPAYKPGQQFDSHWREEPPECNWPEPHDCYLDDCEDCDEPSPECEGGCGRNCACAYDRRDKTEDD